jgi:large subunit ribosomal protein L9
MPKIILTQEVTGLGSPGDVVDVKGGYARNYLLPSGFAVAWSRGGEKQVESLRAARRAREAASIEEAQHMKMKLEANPVRLSVRTGQAGRLFGSVSAADVAQAIESAGIGAVDRRTIELASPIRSTGGYEASIRLREDVTATVSLEVVAAK